MAQINEYFKNKYDSEKEDYKKKLTRHRLAVLYRILLMVAIVVAVTGAFYYNYQNMIYTDYDVLGTLKYQEATTANYLSFNGNVLRYSQDGASAFNMENEMLWNQTFEMQSPMIDICDDYVALGDYKGTKIYVLNGSGLQGEIDTTLPVQKFCVSGNGNVAAVLEEGDITWVKLFNKEGDNIANDRTTMAKSGYPINVAISKDGIMLGVSYLYIDSGNLSSSVAFYNFGEVGQNEIDNLVSGFNYENSVIPYVKFMNGKTSFAVGDDRFEIFSGNQKPENIFTLSLEDEVKSIYNNEDYIGLVYAEGTSEALYRLDVYDTSGTLCLTKKFDLEYSDIIFNKDLVIIYNSNECVIYNMQGVEKYKGSFRNSILTMIPTDNKTKYLLVSGSEMAEIQLK